MTALEETFGSWKSGAAPAKNLATVAKTPGKKFYLIDKPDAPQSTIVAAHVSETSGQAGRFEMLASLENAAISMINYGLPNDYWSRYAGNMRSLPEPQLAVAASKFVRSGEVVWIVIGDLRKIESGIRELNLGEVIRLDASGEPINQ